jgi:serine/threonine protein kinase
MSLRLTVITGPDKGQVFALTGAALTVVGRSKDATARLNDPRVSRVHCEVKLEGNKATLVDKGSASGTLLNGQRVSEQVLRHGDVLRIGDSELRFESGDVAEQTTLAGAPVGGKPVVSATKLEDLSGKPLGHYEVGAVIARGNSGVVFKARDTKEDRQVAFKVLFPELSGIEEEMQRFIRGMKTALPLRHPNLITLYGAGKTGPYCWMAMEFVEGESMTQVIQRIGTANMLDWRYGLRVATHIGRALEYAQQQGIIHRNITPQNIMMQTADKLTKLGDLMLAKAMEGVKAEQITRPGEIVGDIRYMSPERTRGTTEVDGRSDIYSLGATVYALLTGRPPHEGDSIVETISKIRQETPVKPTKYQLAIPAHFEGAVLRMLAKRPEDRYQKATELLVDLERVAKYQGITL